MSLKDKASKINFQGLGTASVENKPAQRSARTAPGQLMELAATQREDLVARVKELEATVESLRGMEEAAGRTKQLQAELQAAQTELAQWDGAKGARLIAAEEIVPSPFANRHVLNFSSAEFKLLLAEIKSAGGNIQPVKVRPLSQPRDGARYELVYGHRRHEACRQLGLPVLALVDNVDDQVMFIEMDRENRTRLDLSPWEQGQMYKRGLELRLFSSLRAMSDEIGVNVSTVSRTLALAELPDEIVEVFASPMDLQFRWAKPLSDVLKDDKEGVLKRARALREQKGQLPAAKVFARLVAVEEQGVSKESYPVHVNGKQLAMIHVSSKGIEVRIGAKVLPNTRVDALREMVEGFLSQEATGQE
jgi:ParB family chromosome partitioning protein